MKIDPLIRRLRSLGSPANVIGMARFGITAKGLLGIPIPVLRKLAKELGQNHELAQQLWDSELHEARLLAGFIDDPKLVTESQMDSWTADFDSWDICDQVCGNLFDRTPFAYVKAKEWMKSEHEFTRRAGFALVAALAVHEKKSTNKKFEQFFPLIVRYSHDDRNFVKKAVNWALRQIGKRNEELRLQAVTISDQLIARHEPSARWIGRDARRELLSDAVRKRLQN